MAESLQAILDATDSSDDENYAPSPHLEIPFAKNSSDVINMDLEAILREDDDGDDDSIMDGMGNDTPRSRATTTIPASSSYAKILSPSNSNSPDRSFQQTTMHRTTASSHNTEDWAVLQAILREDDDGDEESEGEGVLLSKATSTDYEESRDDSVEIMRSLLENTKNSETSMLVDSLLAQSTDEDGDDEDPTALPASISKIVESPSRTLASSALHKVNLGTFPTDSAMLSSFDSTGLSSPPRSSRPDPDGGKLMTHDWVLTAKSHSRDEWTEEEASQRALEQAQGYERKLLRAGHRDIVSPLMVKRRLKPKVNLMARSNTAQTKPTASPARSSSGIAHTPRFLFSGLVENVTLSEISTSMHKHSLPDAKVRCGLPTSLAFNSRFVAVGTQLGIILLYDLFGALRQRLGATANDDNLSARMAGAITSLDLNYNGETCCAGYKSGIIVLWDVIRGSVLRSVDDTHPSPITGVRFFADLRVVSVDAGGLVNKLSFTKNMLWSSYSLEVECLLDGTAGQILAMNVLEPFSAVHPNVRSQATSIVRVLKSLSLIALSSERSSFAVAVEPQVSVLHRWPRPAPDLTDPTQDFLRQKTYLPCLTWGWALTSGSGNIAMPMLARSWGCCLQLLLASFPTLDDPSTSASTLEDGTSIHWPAFGVHQQVDAEAPIVALEWLSERSLVFLTMTNEFTVVDTVMMTVLERLDFSDIRLVYAEFSLSRSVVAAADTATETGVNMEPITCTIFSNSIRCSDKRMLILCEEEVRKVSCIGARQRITSLEEDGEWLEALALALDHYESTVLSQEDRKRDPSGKRDLSRHPEFARNSGAADDEEEWISKLLMRYLTLAVDNAPDANAGNDSLMVPVSGGQQQARINLAQSHFQMLAGVCVEFCVVTRRLDLLFGPIFRRFQEVGYTSVFLDVLEPYVLNDKLSYIAPEVMAYFVEHCKANNGIATVERCLLHMDCTIMDFDSIISLLRSNDMYSALFFVFNQGLNDYVTPLEILLETVFDEADTGNALLSRRTEKNRLNDFDKFGYKAILYLRFCFEGKSFPKEEKIVPEERQASVKPELLQFLIREKYTKSPSRTPTSSASIVGHRSQPYPYMRILLQVDPGLLFDTISMALEAPDAGIYVSSSTESNDHEVRSNSPSKQQLVDIFLSMVLPELSESPSDKMALIKAKQAVSAFLDFTTKYIIRGVVRADEALTFMIMSKLADNFRSALDQATKRAAQDEIMELLSALPRESYEPDKVLTLIEQAGIHRAALLLHIQVASSWDESDDIDLRSRHFISAIDCFIGDDAPDFRLEVFKYIRKECTGGSGSSAVHEGASSLRHALYSRLPRLVQLDSLMTARLVAELFLDDIDSIVESLDIGDGGETQFLFLRSIISGQLVDDDQVAGNVLNLTMDHHLQYLTLMSELHPEMVYDYLSTHDSYRPEDALKLCQDHNIADASAYLLERMGNVSSALQLTLQTLEGRLMGLKRTLRGLGGDNVRHHSRSVLPKRMEKSEQLTNNQKKEVEGVRRILVVALDLCERNSGSYSVRSEHGSQLWFNVLDRLINAKGFLRLANEHPEHAKAMEEVLNELLRLTMQRMVSSVPLLDLVRKVTSDHSGSRLGELREMIVSLLGTYEFELNVFNSAANVFHEDVSKMKEEQRNLVVRAAAVGSIMNVPLKPDSQKAISKLLEDSKSSTVILGAGRNGVLSEGQRETYSQRAESGLASALQRLRNRRTSNEQSRFGSTTTGYSVMTTMERRYREGTLEPVVYDHPVGLLGEAQHRGRLMTFHM